MANKKLCLIYSSFLVVILVVSSGCEKLEETPAAANQPALTSQMVAETTEAEAVEQRMDAMQTQPTDSDTLSSQLTIPNLEDLEERQSEIHSRLQAFIELLDEKENALAMREDSLNKKEQRLQKMEEELNEVETAITWHRIVSWIILVIGIIAIIAGIAIGKSKKTKGDQQKNQKSSNSDSKSQSEPAKKESSQPASKTKTQTQKKSKK